MHVTTAHILTIKLVHCTADTLTKCPSLNPVLNLACNNTIMIKTDSTMTLFSNLTEQELNELEQQCVVNLDDVVDVYPELSGDDYVDAILEGMVF